MGYVGVCTNMRPLGLDKNRTGLVDLVDELDTRSTHARPPLAGAATMPKLKIEN